MASISALNPELLQDPQKMRIILDAADIPINFCSADKIFLFVNKTYARWYNRTPEEIVGKSLVDILGEEGNTTIRPYYERALDGESVSYETEVNLSIGLRYIQCNYSPVTNEAGVVTGWVGIIYDMTHRYLLEKALYENEIELKLERDRAQEANIAKSEFLATMSHEIRTPMNVILGLSNLLGQSKPLTPKQGEFIDTLKSSANSLLLLINDLLDFSKIEYNAVQLEHIAYDIRTVVKEVISLFAIDAQNKGIALGYDDRGCQENTSFYGDPLRIRQVLVNLVGNALKFTHAGSVTLAIKTKGGATSDQTQLTVEVQDTGIGIPESKIGSVFEKFIQADMSITRQYGGSGLGLAISKNLAELMGGTITVTSVAGKGSAFTLHIVAENADARKPESQTKLASPSARQKETIHVLLAEDHMPNILVATTLLDLMGYTYDVAHNGREVLAKIQDSKKSYDVILMDVEMPVLDGYSTTRLIRQQEPAETHVPIIGMTAHVMTENVQKCFDVGMDDYIAKPYKSETLQAKILSNVKSNAA